jgi:hypothetical protein
MNSQNKWIKNKMRTGWAVLTGGALVAIIGILMEPRSTNLSFDPRIISGAGILLIGVGVSNLVRYGLAVRDAQSARRLSAEERDERGVLIRSRAGNRAYWVSAALIYAGLMWDSFAANGKLPDLSGDTLWFFLAACVIIPLIVYITSLIYDEHRV